MNLLSQRFSVRLPKAKLPSMTERSEKEKNTTEITFICAKCNKEVHRTYLRDECFPCMMRTIFSSGVSIFKHRPPTIKGEPIMTEIEYEETEIGSNEDQQQYQDVFEISIMEGCLSDQGDQDETSPQQQVSQPMVDQNIEITLNKNCRQSALEFQQQIYLKLYNAFVLKQQHYMEVQQALDEAKKAPKVELKRPPPEKSSNTGRCNQCNKKTGIYGILCPYCKVNFCNLHRIPQKHHCGGDLKTEGKRKLGVQLMQGKAFQKHKGKVLQI